MASLNMVGRTIKPAGVGLDTHYYGDSNGQMVSFPRVRTSCQRKLSLNVHFSIETIWRSTLSSDEVCHAGETQQVGGRYCNCSPDDIVEAQLCCYKIDLLFQWVGNQRGTFMFVDSIGLLVCQRVGKKRQNHYQVRLNC